RLPAAWSLGGARTLRLRLNTDAVAAGQAPTMAVSPSAESATDIPWPKAAAGSPSLRTPLPTSLLPCWLQTPPLRVNTQAAPVVLLSLGPPMIAVPPLAESATDIPWDHNPPPKSAVVPISLPPC